MSVRVRFSWLWRWVGMGERMMLLSGGWCRWTEPVLARYPMIGGVGDGVVGKGAGAAQAGERWCTCGGVIGGLGTGADNVQRDLLALLAVMGVLIVVVRGVWVCVS